MKRLAVLVLILVASAPLFAQARKAPGKGRPAVLDRLDQNIGRAIEGATLSDKQKASLDKDRQALRLAASARRDGLNEDRKATDKALGDIEKIFKDKKLNFDASLRQTVQQDVAELRGDARNQPKRNARTPRSPNPFPRYPNPRRPRW